MSATQHEVSPPRLTELVGRLAKDVQALVWGELKLARAELGQKLHRVIIAAILLIGGALLAFAGVVVILQSMAAVLALVLPTWAAQLIIGIVIVAIGGLFARSGLGMLTLKALTPHRTQVSLKKDVCLVKEHI